MAKIRINSCLINETKNEENVCNTNGILIKNKIVYYDSEIKVTIDISEDNIVINRYTDNSNYIYLSFNKDKSICKCYTNNKFVELNINLLELSIKGNVILVKYEVENTDVLFFKLNYGE